LRRSKAQPARNRSSKSISQKVQLLPFPEGEIDVDTHGDFARLESTNYSDTSKSADLN